MNISQVITHKYPCQHKYPPQYYDPQINCEFNVTKQIEATTVAK